MTSNENGCTCKYATAENTASVRNGYEMGGYVTELCDYCKKWEAEPANLTSNERADRIRESTHSEDCYKWHHVCAITRLETLQADFARLTASNAELVKALVSAVDVIREWHNMGVPQAQRSELWDIYWRKAPELTSIRAALKGDAT